MSNANFIPSNVLTGKPMPEYNFNIPSEKAVVIDAARQLLDYDPEEDIEVPFPVLDYGEGIEIMNFINYMKTCLNDDIMEHQIWKDINKDEWDICETISAMNPTKQAFYEGVLKQENCLRTLFSMSAVAGFFGIKTLIFETSIAINEASLGLSTQQMADILGFTPLGDGSLIKRADIKKEKYREVMTVATQMGIRKKTIVLKKRQA